MIHCSACGPKELADASLCPKAIAKEAAGGMHGTRDKKRKKIERKKKNTHPSRHITCRLGRNNRDSCFNLPVRSRHKHKIYKLSYFSSANLRSCTRSVRRQRLTREKVLLHSAEPEPLCFLHFPFSRLSQHARPQGDTTTPFLENAPRFPTPTSTRTTDPAVFPARSAYFSVLVISRIFHTSMSTCLSHETRDKPPTLAPTPTTKQAVSILRDSS